MCDTTYHRHRIRRALLSCPKQAARNRPTRARGPSQRGDRTLRPPRGASTLFRRTIPDWMHNPTHNSRRLALQCLVLWFCVSLLCDRHRPSCVHPYRVGVPVVGRTVFRLPINQTKQISLSQSINHDTKHGIHGLAWRRTCTCHVAAETFICPRAKATVPDVRRPALSAAGRRGAAW